MKNGVSVLNHDVGFKTMKKDLVRRYGADVVEHLWQRAGKNLEELCRRYACLPRAVKAHTDGNMFRNAAPVSGH